MSKICGYSCEHNKSGVCQISVCDKTEVQTFTRYIDPTITKLQQENQKYKEVINKAIEYINNLRIWYEHNDNICSTEDKFKNDLLEILKEEEND